MQREVGRVRAWLAEVMPPRPQGYFLGPYLTHHIDDLVGDMGLPTRRTSNFLTEYLGSFSPTRYRDLAEHRQLARKGNIHPRRTYVSAGHAIGGLAALTFAHAVRRRRQAGNPIG